MNLEELHDALEEVFPDGFHLETDEDGQLIVHTRLCEDDDGELMAFESDDDDDEDLEEDEDMESYDESDNYDD
jgi:hypothetical protein